MPEGKESFEEANRRVAADALAKQLAAEEAAYFKREVAGTLVVTHMDHDARHLLSVIHDISGAQQVGKKRPQCRIEASLTLAFYSKLDPKEFRYVTVPEGSILVKETKNVIFIEQGGRSLSMDRRNNGALVLRRSTFGAECHLAVPHYYRGVQQAIIAVR